MSLAYATELAQKVEAAKNEATEYLTPYLTGWFELERETDKYYDKNEAQQEYDFLHIDEAGWFVFQTEDYTNTWGDYVGTHNVYVPGAFIENPVQFATERREAKARAEQKKRDSEAAERIQRIARLEAQLAKAKEEAELAK